ncbi:hypothetical protein ACI77I_25995 [Pseudomonas sp. D47]|uniref:hypothetical protein n=1 Tax=Pseudomonas sp. D47 TaxID=3159447 RepID=UPI00387B659C
MARATQNKPAASGKDAGPTAPGIRVRSFGPLFHRAGRQFTSESLDILLADLTEEQLAAIEGEARLSSQRIDMPLGGAEHNSDDLSTGGE